MKKIFIVGLGLIGGSIARNIKETQTDCFVYGYDQDESTIEYALMNQIIDEKVDTFEKGVDYTDIIILATPITITIGFIKKLDKINELQNKIIMDVGSVKRPVMEAVEKLENENVVFIGGHPMAGSHKQGVEAAKSHLFENAYFVLIPGKRANNEHVELVKDLLKGTKSNFVELSVDEHDKMIGIVSHFPHLIASSLVHQAINWQSEFPFIPKLAAGGFRDITRIASSNPKLWQDIFFQNKNEMIGFISDWIKEMKKVKELIETNQRPEILRYLDQAKQYRDGLPKKEKGAIPNIYDIYVDIYDKPGELYKVIKLFAEHNINIINIQILEIREDMTGVLRLTVQTKEAQQKGKILLENHNYDFSIEE